MKSTAVKLAAGRTFGALSQLAGVGLLLTSAWLIVRAAEQPPVLYLMVAVVSVRFFGLARAALRYCERLLTHDAAFAAITEARVSVHRELDRVAPAGMDQRRRGDLVSRVVSDVDALLDRMLRLRSPWVSAIAAAAAVVLLLGFLAPVAAVVVAVFAAVSMLLIRLMMGMSAARRDDVAFLRGELAAEVDEAVRAAPDLVALGATARVIDQIERRSTDLAVAQRRGAAAAAAAGSVVQALTGLAMAANVVLTPELSPVLVGVIVLAPLALLEPLEALADAERLRPQIAAAEHRLAELADAATPVVDPDRPDDLPDRWDLVVEDLVVGWDEPVAAPVSFRVAPGEAVVISGRSGIGKSTLGLTLARLVEPLGGSIALGGVDLTRLSGAEVRRRIGVLSQDEVVFDTTIRENLRIADPRATDPAMHAALTSAGLSDFVASLPRGLDTSVGDGGSALSGGERQRLCLARLLLGDHRILVVDEPTEHLDAQAGQALMRDLLALCPERTLLVISHHDVGISSRVEMSGEARDLVSR